MSEKLPASCLKLLRLRSIGCHCMVSVLWEILENVVFVIDYVHLLRIFLIVFRSIWGFRLLACMLFLGNVFLEVALIWGVMCGNNVYLRLCWVVLRLEIIWFTLDGCIPKNVQLESVFMKRILLKKKLVFVGNSACLQKNTVVRLV